jgi:hypothetical protein
VGKTIEIMFDDLVESKKKEILKGIGIKKPEEMNWDIVPITIIEVEMEGQEK